jgi:hypothetical protein
VQLTILLPLDADRAIPVEHAWPAPKNKPTRSSGSLSTRAIVTHRSRLVHFVIDVDDLDTAVASQQIGPNEPFNSRQQRLPSHTYNLTER